MNGWEFLEEYKKLDDEQKGGVVVVMLTTSLNPDDKKMADGDGNVTEFMNKPLNIEKFQSVLEKYFPDRLK
jgi:CheY-like chemotaxis protein